MSWERIGAALHGQPVTSKAKAVGSLRLWVPSPELVLTELRLRAAELLVRSQAIRKDAFRDARCVDDTPMSRCAEAQAEAKMWMEAVAEIERMLEQG